MSVYVDNFNVKADVPNGNHVVRGVWCHMTADTREELDAMADAIGLRRSWIQHPGTWKEHYDVTKSKRALAVRNGAIEIDFRQAAEMHKRRREADRVHWVGDAPTSLHGNGASSFERTTRDPAEVTCRLCLSLLARESEASA